MSKPQLLVMRLRDMNFIHPDQDDSRICDRCGYQVGIYPSGQEFLLKFADARIVCNVCADLPIPLDAPSAKIRQEVRDSRKREE